METVSGVLCEVCHAKEAVVRCDGCGKALCKECRVFDIWCYGCGHGNTKAFCKKCNDDPAINIWKTPV
ncbi:MAG TPA: hypothetical protein PL059_08050 [Spirochaetota bacterium]|nr:hypothetical protein [Spirochaetota bacterium]HOJ29013.1 hypothetical protein [Spirochaetota bacterium]HOM09962.1 hypothetical protein [Spirochaetota bacterium]HPP50029.1 hypothetical protein [Spirochaetota bacterium]